LFGTSETVGEDCSDWKMWSDSFWGGFAIYVGFAVLFGFIAGAVTMTTAANLPAASQDDGEDRVGGEGPLAGKSMFMAAGSGIPEIKTILSGFVIPHFLDFKVLLVKAVGASFAVATGMCLGKEGPFVHISTCVGYLVASLFPKYLENGRKMREMLSVACSSGLSVAFGAPIGGVLFSYEVRQI
jgi:chloride channel 3/4/5